MIIPWSGTYCGNDSMVISMDGGGDTYVTVV